MKNLVLVFSISVFGQLYSQTFQKHGIDSLRNIRWDSEVLATDENNIPVYYERSEYKLIESDRIVIINCSTNRSLGGTYFIPDECLQLMPNDTSQVNEKHIGALMGPRTIISDSLQEIEIKQRKTQDDCTEKYFLDHVDSLKIDTISVDGDYPFYTGDNKLDRIYLLKRYWVLFDQKIGTETAYYSLEELKDICIIGNFRIKYIGKWKDGQKHGKWQEFDKTGKLVTSKKYKKGTLKKEKHY